MFVSFLLITLWFVWLVCTSFNGFIRVRLSEQVGITKQRASNGSDTLVIQCFIKAHNISSKPSLHFSHSYHINVWLSLIPKASYDLKQEKHVRLIK